MLPVTPQRVSKARCRESNPDLFFAKNVNPPEHSQRSERWDLNPQNQALSLRPDFIPIKVFCRFSTVTISTSYQAFNKFLLNILY